MQALMDRARAAAQPPQPGAAAPPRRPPPQAEPALDDDGAEGAESGEEDGSAFERPDITSLIPKGQEDAVARIVAAGMKFMYSPQAKPEIDAALQNGGPMAQSLAMNVTGLILTLDQKSQGGLPAEAIFPAALELLGEATEVFEAAGKPVSQADYADAARLLMVLIAKKMGASDEQIMGEAQKHVSLENGPGSEPEVATPTGEEEQLA